MARKLITAFVCKTAIHNNTILPKWCSIEVLLIASCLLGIDIIAPSLYLFVHSGRQKIRTLLLFPAGFFLKLYMLSSRLNENLVRLWPEPDGYFDPWCFYTPVSDKLLRNNHYKPLKKNLPIQLMLT